MPNTNASYTPESRSHRIQAQIDKLEDLCHRPSMVSPSMLADFDSETEDLLVTLFGANNRRVETYKYATMGEAETMVNMPEEAQEPMAQDIPLKSIQQRRQVLEGCLTDLDDREAREVQALTGEDHEDPPGMS
jgi:hypothetical protein